MVFPWLQDVLGKQPSDQAVLLAMVPLHWTLSSSIWAGYSLLILQRCPQATAAPDSFTTAWVPLGERRGEVSLPLCHKRQAPSKQQVQQWQSQNLYDDTGNKGHHSGEAINRFGHILQCDVGHISPPWKVNRGRDREWPKTDTNPHKPTRKFHNEVLGPWHYTWQIHHTKIQRNKTAPHNFRAWEYVQYHLKLGEINFPDSLFKRKVGYVIKRNKPLSKALLRDQQKQPF